MWIFTNAIIRHSVLLFFQKFINQLKKKRSEQSHCCLPYWALKIRASPLKGIWVINKTLSYWLLKYWFNHFNNVWTNALYFDLKWGRICTFLAMFTLIQDYSSAICLFLILCQIEPVPETWLQCISFLFFLTWRQYFCFPPSSMTLADCDRFTKFGA